MNPDEENAKVLALLERFVVAVETLAAASKASAELATFQFEKMDKRMDELS